MHLEITSLQGDFTDLLDSEGSKLRHIYHRDAVLVAAVRLHGYVNVSVRI